MKDMKEIRILIAEDHKWDDDEWEYLEDELRSVMNRWVLKRDYTYHVWDVG